VAIEAQALKERKNIEELIAHPGTKELENYMHAVEMLMKSTDAENYMFFANLHNEFSPQCDHGCEHWNDIFLPWHRSQLYAFEKALQEIDPPRTSKVTIPYWNWTKAHSGKRYPKEFERSGSVLCDKVVLTRPGWNNFHARRNKTMSGPFVSASDMTETINENEFWRDFGGGVKTHPCFRSSGGELEHDYHDPMHGTYINGDMSNPSRAARDPIFWSFHAYIDLLFDRWQKKHGKSPTSLNSTLRGLTVKNKVGDVVDVTDLGYFYTHAPADITPPIAPLIADMGPRTIRAHQPVTAENSKLGTVTYRFKVPKGGFKTAHVRFINVKVPETISYEGALYLYPADKTFEPKDEAFSKAYRLKKSFFMWQGHAGHAGGHDDVRADSYRRITKELQGISQDHVGENWQLTLVAAPVVPEVEDISATAVQPKTLAQEFSLHALEVILDRSLDEPGAK